MSTGFARFTYQQVYSNDPMLESIRKALKEANIMTDSDEDLPHYKEVHFAVDRGTHTGAVWLGVKGNAVSLTAKLSEDAAFCLYGMLREYLKAKNRIR
jgi:hypothetical protein